MKNLTKILFSIAAMLVVFASCNKDDNDYFDANKQFGLDLESIKSFVSTNLPDAKLDSASGISYKILAEGDGVYQYKTKDTLVNGVTKQALVYPKITVNYTGKLLNGTTFDENVTTEGFSSSLSRLIPAWQTAFFPKKIGENTIGGLTVAGLTKGSKIRIVTPSYWAYGNYASGKVPANSPLDFIITVLNVQ